uniref:HTH CENPB-type domain-containing protein n=1 Tax=Strongyloides papillosus TaxID=174720 RepID=A0A0N5BK13_STREA
MDCRPRGIAVNTVKIGIQARKLAMEQQIYGFKAGSSWVNRFMKRNDLSVRATTSTGQKLPPDYVQKLEEFRRYVYQEIRGLNDTDIVNMDEVSVAFDVPRRYTVDKKGVQDVSVRTTGNDMAKEVLQQHTKIAVIPDGMTKLLQPLDISVNKSFKANLKNHWDE